MSSVSVGAVCAQTLVRSRRRGKHRTPVRSVVLLLVARAAWPPGGRRGPWGNTLGAQPLYTPLER